MSLLGEIGVGKANDGNALIKVSFPCMLSSR